MVLTNGLSKFRVKLGPGLSLRIRMSMIALYCTCGFDAHSFIKNFLICCAAAAAADGELSAASTIAGRWRTSSPPVLMLPDSQKSLIDLPTLPSGESGGAFSISGTLFALALCCVVTPVGS
jgi:hypothetical protein